MAPGAPTPAGTGTSPDRRSTRRSRSSRNRSRRRTCRAGSCNRGRGPPGQRWCSGCSPGRHSRRRTARTRIRGCPRATSRRCSGCPRDRRSRRRTGLARTRRHPPLTTRACTAGPRRRGSPRRKEWARIPAGSRWPRRRCSGSRRHTHCRRCTGSLRRFRPPGSAARFRSYWARTCTAGAGIGRRARRSAGTRACTRRRCRRSSRCNPCPRRTPPGTAGYLAAADSPRAPNRSTRPSTRRARSGRNPPPSGRHCWPWAASLPVQRRTTVLQNASPAAISAFVLASIPVAPSLAAAAATTRAAVDSAAGDAAGGKPARAYATAAGHAAGGGQAAGCRRRPGRRAMPPLPGMPAPPSVSPPLPPAPPPPPPPDIPASGPGTSTESAASGRWPAALPLQPLLAKAVRPARPTSVPNVGGRFIFIIVLPTSIPDRRAQEGDELAET